MVAWLTVASAELGECLDNMVDPLRLGQDVVVGLLWAAIYVGRREVLQILHDRGDSRNGITNLMGYAGGQFTNRGEAIIMCQL